MIGPFCMTLPVWLGTGRNFDGIDFEKSFHHMQPSKWPI